jgi:hypothetical protein
MLPDQQFWDYLLDIGYIRIEWLHHFCENPTDGHLSLASQAALKNIWQDIDQGYFDPIWPACKQVRRQVIENGAPDEIGDILVELARIEAHFGRLEEASRLIDDAANRVRQNEHEYAVVLWLAGNLRWKMGYSEKYEALQRWEASRTNFQAICSNYRLGNDRCQWYHERIKDMDRFLALVESNLGQAKAASQGPAKGASPNQPSPPIQPAPGGPSPGKPPASPQPKKYPSRQPAAGILKSYPVLPDPVSAGSFKAMAEQGFPGLEHIYMEEVVIAGETYLVYGLRGSQVVPLTGSKFTYVIQVIGDSMDAYPILPGDYVLVNSNLQPKAGDVVITRIVKDQGDVPSASIKYLRSIDEINNKFVLEYRSNNPRYQGWQIEFDRSMKGSADILGVATARFTRKEKAIGEEISTGTTDIRFDDYPVYTELLSKVGRDQGVANRLIDHERKNQPNDPPEEWIKSAIIRLEQDRR